MENTDPNRLPPTGAENSRTGRIWRTTRRFTRKVVGFVAMGFLMGFLADYAGTRNDPSHPAGLAWGMAHGALMPTALPALVMGKDVTIYAPNNQGRLYKIGYALGVNVCGLLFFGLVFWTPARTESKRGTLPKTVPKP
ncbi:MAG: hypothetical protein K9N62_04855 [Verrucomicrobia bacterium]|nr:hypothetical protein [Verrucomicrobiota bacterium]